jgi:hypothetical protein
MNIGKTNFEQLRTSVEWSLDQLGTPRQNRLNAIKEYVGFHYSDNGSDFRVPTNMLELAITIYTRQLAAQAPRALVNTSITALKPFAKNMEIALNQVPEEIDLSTTLRMAVIEALFSIGIVKVGTAATGNIIMGHDVGESFVDLVTLDDYVCDMAAKSRKTMQWEGNDYWMPIDVVRDLYDNKKIQADEQTLIGPGGDDRAESIGIDEGAEVYKDKVLLRDIYIFETNKIITYGVTQHEILNVMDWDGPDRGPYRVLGFSDVPGNILPLPPASLWMDLHELGNQLFRKLGKQALSKKRVATFPGGNDEDVQALKNANDGEGIKYKGQEPKDITVGGIDAESLAFYLQTRDLFSYFAGNLDTLGGLSPMADTVGQDKLLTEAAGARVNHMKGQTIAFTKSIYKALAWYEWTDPIRTRKLDKRVEGTDVILRVNWTPETRDGDFLDYNIDIDVYSMQDETPSVKLQKLGMILERYVYPVLPMIQEQGGQFNIKALLELVGELSHVPELKDLIVFGDPMNQASDPIIGNPNPMAMPAHTTRTYERVSRSGSTRSGNDNIMSKLLMGLGTQEKEVNKLQ